MMIIRIDRPDADHDREFQDGAGMGIRMKDP